MPISKDNFIVVYRLNNSDSREFAQYYADIHNMSYSNPSDGETSGTGWLVDGQLVGIDCSDDEILDNEEQFNTQVLIPLQNAIDYYIASQTRVVWGIVLGYNVPGGFRNMRNPSVPYTTELNTIISSTSRVATGCAKRSGSYHTFNGKKENKFYNRVVFKRFDEDDAEFALVVSRIDAPTLALAKEIVNNASLVNKQFQTNGIFYIDPYADKMGQEAQNYTQLLVDFNDNILPKLNLDTWSTIYMDPYKDVVIPFVANDSFTWSWFTDRGYSDFFQSTNAIRVFFYNADFDGAYTIRNANGNTWPILSLTNGYAISAGAMSNPGISGFLNPTPFFEALNQDATIGEAYLFSLPYLDWTLTLFGDPLTYVSFVSETPLDNTILTEDESWFLMSQDLGRVAAYLYKEDIELFNMRNIIVDLQELAAEIAILYPSNSLYLENNTARRKIQLTQLVSSLFEYITRQYRYKGLNEQFPTINDYLTQKGFKISRLLTEVVNEELFSSSNLLDEGYWEFEFVLQNDSFNYANYQFELKVYSNSRRHKTDKIYVRNSGEDSSNWYYEKEINTYYEIPLTGVPASYIGRRIKYISDTSEYLDRGETYYFDITQIDILTGISYQTRESSNIIFT